MTIRKIVSRTLTYAIVALMAGACAEAPRQIDPTPPEEAAPIPVDQFLIRMPGEGWSYSPVNSRRERNVSLLYLARDGNAFQLTGTVYESTFDMKPSPVFNTSQGGLLEVGKWQTNGSSIRFTYACSYGDQYMVVPEPCKTAGTIELARHGTILWVDRKDDSKALIHRAEDVYEPIERAYPDSWTNLRADIISNACARQNGSEVERISKLC